MTSTFTPHQIVQILHESGYRADISESEDYDYTIESGSGGLKWILELGDVQEFGTTESARFIFLVSVDPMRYPIGKICNDFNLNMYVGVAQYIFPEPEDEDQEVTLLLGHYLDFTGGVSVEWFKHQLMCWSLAVDKFRATLIENREAMIDSSFEYLDEN
jgi:hypothetical protein